MRFTYGGITYTSEVFAGGPEFVWIASDKSAKYVVQPNIHNWILQALGRKQFKKAYDLMLRGNNILAEMKAENMVALALQGIPVSALIESMLGGDLQVRTYYDSGFVRFATLNDIDLDPSIDSRIETIMNLVNAHTWPNDHPFWRMFDDYQGSLQGLYQKVLGDLGN